VAVLWACVALPAQAAVSDTVTMFSEGEYIGGGQMRLYDTQNASISISGDASYLTVHVSGGSLGESFDLDFAAPPGETLHPGLYLNAQRAPFREATHPGIDISGDGRGCNEDTGRFDIKDIRLQNGAVRHLWLTYEQHCEGGVAALFGDVRIGEAPLAPRLTVAPRMIWWPDGYPGVGGQTVPVTAINTGTENISLGRASLHGLNAGDFKVRVDDCAGTTLGPGDLCEVWVRFIPLLAGPRVAKLRIPKVGATPEFITLDGFGTPGKTKWTMHSDPGDYIGAGRDWYYTPKNAVIAAGGSRTIMHFSMDGNQGDWWYADFDPSSGDILAPGDYPNATRYPFNGSGNGLSVDGNGRGCNTLTGSFSVTYASFNADGTVRGFGVQFVQHCEGADPALRGTILYRVPTGDTTPPAKVTNLQVGRSNGVARVSWTNPPEADYAATLVRRLPGTFAPGSPNSGRLVYAGTGTSVRFPDPKASEITVAAFTVDTFGNAGRGVALTAP
jgi:hypothetical protein